MKPDFEDIQELKRRSFALKKIVRKNRLSLSAAWHYHPEIEICYTKKSSGKRYVGNHISHYESGDLVMFGSYLPHGFTTTQQTSQIVLQFRDNFLLHPFGGIDDLNGIQNLFMKARMGLEIKGKTKNQVIIFLELLNSLKGLQRFIKFLQLISLLEKSTDCHTICNERYASSINITQLGRMQVIFDYLESNFRSDITISDAAAVINLTDSAFYKFVRRHTKKKFTQLLNEYRIDHAAKRLSNTNMTVAEICFDSGYKNLSYFNRKFKETHHISPSEYRDKFVM